jgi:nucleotide-binding universal stress UspA family protein
VYAHRPPFEYLDTPFVGRAPRDERAAAADTLAQIGEDIVGAVALERVVVETPVAEALVAVARERQAAEIVVGSRGLGRFRAAIGSVSHAVLHEADRPVVVVPHERSPEEVEGPHRARRVRTFASGIAAAVGQARSSTMDE